MNKYLLRGGRRLEGRVSVHGAKNSVLPILAATIVTGGERIIHNCPDLSDVDASVAILKHLGCRAERQGKTLWVDSSDVCRNDIPDHLMREMRSSVMFMGAVAARAGKVEMTYPGGCELGARPIDLHIDAFDKMGAEIQEENGKITCLAEKLSGGVIELRFPSVGATENIMLAAANADGKTIIKNAAREPEICDLANFLRTLGMEVVGDGTSVIEICGRCRRDTIEYTVMPDRIVAATYLSCVAACGGHVCLENVIPEHVTTVRNVLDRAGCRIDVSDMEMTITAPEKLRGAGSVATRPYPGFPTDAQSPVMAALLKAEGTTIFYENIFENRYRHVKQLLRLGADIKIEGRRAVVTGTDSLQGAKLEATDLRGGAAVTVAALAAQGESEITGLSHIDRGYEKFDEALRSIGADIVRV